MCNSFDDIYQLYQAILAQPKLDDSFCIIFVYNSPTTMGDNLHTSECILDEELHMILSAFKMVAENVYAIDGEENFMRQIVKYKKMHSYVLVYSMAQNIQGNGRRSLIPLLCDYHHLINIGADFMSCTLGRSKDYMYSILEPCGFPFPQTYYIYRNIDIEHVLPIISNGKWLLKPNNESSSIGMEVHIFSEKSMAEIREYLHNYHKTHPVFCIQEFIDGEEVAVPILKIANHYYCPGISQVDFPEGKNYIDYDMVSLETYGYFEYSGPIKDKLLDISAKVSKQLNLTAMSRIDFRIRDDIAYIEDIGANPTISENNGVNQLYCEHLNAEPWCVYAILVYTALIEHNLFDPPFHHAPNDRSNY